MRHAIDVLDAPGDELHPAVIPRVCDNDIIILHKEGMPVCALMVYGISDCLNSKCLLNVHNRCTCMFKVKGVNVSLLHVGGCTMKLKHIDKLLEDL